MGTRITVDIAIDPDRMDEFLAYIASIISDTRGYDGCQQMDVLLDQDKAGRVLFYEVWDSRAHYEKYVAWRTETGVMEKLGGFLTAPPEFGFLDLADI